MKKVIYIEGTSETDNGSLRKAFSELLRKELAGDMPKIIMGDGKNQTIDKFHSTPTEKEEKRFLLFDSDEANPNKSSICKTINDSKSNRKIDATLDNTFLMIQEVEAWILSQPEILSQRGLNVSKLNITDVETVSKPSEMLSDLYRKNQLAYTKVREFVKVFPLLDTSKLKEDCPEFKALIEALAKH